jgi:hypothetical protein
VLLTPDGPVFFKFNGSKAIQIDRDWLRRLEQSGSSSTGLIGTNAVGDVSKVGPSAGSAEGADGYGAVARVG